MTKEFETLVKKGMRKLQREVRKLRDNTELVEEESNLYYEINSIACMIARLQDLIEVFVEEEEI